jgi:undecaprenyl-diphosphatase
MGVVAGLSDEAILNHPTTSREARCHWRRATLFSVPARRGFVAPDLSPLPGVRRHRPSPPAGAAAGHANRQCGPGPVGAVMDTWSVVRSPSDVLRRGRRRPAPRAPFRAVAVGSRSSTSRELLVGLSAVPTWLVDVIVIVTRLLAVVALVGGLVIAVRSGGWRMVGTAGLGAAIAAVLILLLEASTPARGPAVTVSDSLGPLTATGFPTAVGLGTVTAALTAAAPWLSRRARRIGWALVIALALNHFLITPASFDTLRAVLCGWLAGAAALVVLGGPSRRPTLATVSAALAGVGVPLAHLEQASVDARSSTPYFGATTDGQALFVKALGADQRSADLLFRTYRTVSRRQLGDERPFSSLRRTVEHEALVALAARDEGILTPRLVASTAEPNSFVLAYEAVEGRSLDRVAPDELTDPILADAWAQVSRLRRHRIAHRDLRLANIFLAADGRIWLIDFGFSELAASDLLLVTTSPSWWPPSSLKVRPERAVAAAWAAVPADELAGAADRLRPWALSGATRTGLKQSPGLLDDLRARVQAAPPEPDRGLRTAG